MISARARTSRSRPIRPVARMAALFTAPVSVLLMAWPSFPSRLLPDSARVYGLLDVDPIDVPQDTGREDGGLEIAEAISDRHLPARRRQPDHEALSIEDPLDVR